jgi:hypothetical protein
MPMRLSARLTLVLAAAALCGPAFAQDSAGDASGASGATSQAVGLLTASGVKTAIGVSAVPVSVAAVGASGVAVAGASVGQVAGGAASELAHGAGNMSEASLKVDDRVVVAPDPAPKVPYKAQTPAAHK